MLDVAINTVHVIRLTTLDALTARPHSNATLLYAMLDCHQLGHNKRVEKSPQSVRQFPVLRFPAGQIPVRPGPVTFTSCIFGASP